ncbi:MAG: hypothetical protein HON76_10600 [Candidatus Scalindua sp.]|nr:hypothetical protein [Candidatus Scalindua sp.]MBT6562962.1 hypothetical protein [Candidatus Scalindua sp.]MBT7212237.1 hypothetical protein [Candidatus Scalindua sp.]MBT7592148.1 hypothetical protein [Candidatus Scalindua sp.]
MADAAILRFDVPAYRLMKMAMPSVKSMIVDLICANFTHSVEETTLHI